MARRNLSLEERFMQHVSPEPNTGCWLWTGSLDTGGYGNLTIDGKPARAHRVAWELANGAIPKGQHCLHSCDVRSCVSVEHLFLGSHLDNMIDKSVKGRCKKSKRGLPFGVSVNKGSARNPYIAHIKVNGRTKHLGSFPTAEEAGRVAQDWKDRLSGR